MAKLDKVKFARLIGFIADRIRKGYEITVTEIEYIDSLIDIEAPTFSPSLNPEQLHVLMELMQEGTRKIEAIRRYRMLTGYGLKESKDIIDKYWRPVEPQT